MSHYKRVGFSLALVASAIHAGSMPVGAGEIQSLASIRMQAESFIAQHDYKSPYPARFQLGRLDSRLRLQACRETLKVDFARPNQVLGNTALLVRCPVAPGWKIHLPAQIEVFDDVLVTAKPLLKGQKIDEKSVGFEKRNIARLKNGYYGKNSQLDELEAKRNLAGGTVLTPSNLSARLMVRSGQQVTLVLNYNGLQIRSSGKALRSASLGQLVRVRNSQSLKVVEGIVSGEALVKVGL